VVLTGRVLLEVAVGPVLGSGLGRGGHGGGNGRAGKSKEDGSVHCELGFVDDSVYRESVKTMSNELRALLNL
jgi:hypothetical protein